MNASDTTVAIIDNQIPFFVDIRFFSKFYRGFDFVFYNEKPVFMEVLCFDMYFIKAFYRDSKMISLQMVDFLHVLSNK